MYIKEFFGSDMNTTATAYPPWGPGFTEAQVAKASMLQVCLSSFCDEGEDCTEFKLLDKEGHVLGQKRIAGF